MINDNQLGIESHQTLKDFVVSSWAFGHNESSGTAEAGTSGPLLLSEALVSPLTVCRKSLPSRPCGKQGVVTVESHEHNLDAYLDLLMVLYWRYHVLRTVLASKMFGPGCSVTCLG